MTTYYVKSEGLDTSNGTAPDRAWKTMSKVNGFTFAAGDSCLFERGGTWYETLTPHDNGTATGYISYGAYGSGPKPIINGGTVTSGFALVSGSWDVTLAAQPYVVVTYGVWGKQQASKAACIAPGDWYWVASTLSVFWPSNPSGYCCVGARTTGIAAAKNYNNFDSFHITNVQKYGILYTGSNYGSVTNCDFDSIAAQASFSGFGIDLACNYVNVTNCTFNNINDAGVTITPSTTGCVVSYCTFNNCWNGNEYGGGGEGWSLYLNNAVACTIHHNYCVGAYMSVVMGGHGNLAYNNTVVNAHVNCIGNMSTDGGAANGWYNNTIIHNPTGNAGHGMMAETTGDHAIFKNNLVYVGSALPTQTNVSAVSIELSTYTDITIDNNLVFVESRVNIPIWKIASTLIYRLKDFQAGCRAANGGAGWQGNEMHGIYANPQLDPTYHLLPSSPAINAGTAIAGIGQTAVQGAPDIGAYEYSPSSYRREFCPPLNRFPVGVTR